MDDIAALLQAAFADELAEHLAGMRAALAMQAAGGTVDLREFFRRAHSLKGAARAVEQPETEALAHRLESVLEAMMRGERALDAAALPELHSAIDAIEDAAGIGTADSADASIRAAAGPVDPPPETIAAEGTLRVSERHVEQLTRSVHGLASGVAAQAVLADGLAAMEGDLQALAAALARGGRVEAERRLLRLTMDAGRLRRAQARSRWELDRAVAELEADAERIMLVPVVTLFDGYERMVREVADGQGKAALLHVDAGDTTADRRVLQALREPVLHILRNAVGHGIEPPAARIAAGKPPQGLVSATASVGRGRLLLTITDDGGGLDDAAIAARAQAAGLIASGAAVPAGAALHRLLFEQGLSTARSVDALSGRGVGLWVVADAARRLHGHATIAPATDAGGGTVLTVDVPLMTARQAVMLFECGGAVYGLPAAAVARVMRLDDDAIVRAAAGAVVVIDAVPVPVVALSAVLGVATAPAGEGGGRAALLLHGGTLILVDALVAVLSAAIGDPGAIAADAPLVAGTLLLDDGRVALLLAADAIIAAAGRSDALPVIASPDPVRQRTILVVDDSITTRTLERGILEAAGYAVRLSVDGLAGLDRLRAEPGEIDLVVADVEMPRMDGFGLLAAIRNDPALRGIPVVMMTSRSSPDDIERGLELGANAYCIKQEFEQGMLLSVIGQLI